MGRCPFQNRVRRFCRGGGKKIIDWPRCCVRVPFLALVTWNEFRNLHHSIRELENGPLSIPRAGGVRSAGLTALREKVGLIMSSSLTSTNWDTSSILREEVQEERVVPHKVAAGLPAAGCCDGLFCLELNEARLRTVRLRS